LLRTHPAGARLAVLVGAEACEVPPHASPPVLTHKHADVLLLPRNRVGDPATRDEPAEVAAAVHGTVHGTVLLPALRAEEAALSSGVLRRVIAERNLDEANLRTLSAHGYHGARVDAALCAAFGCTPELWLEQVSEGAKDRGEWVEPLVAVCDT
jgi:predicted outer membrane lipoprotein